MTSKRLASMEQRRRNPRAAPVTKLAPAKVEVKSKEAARKDKLSDKRVQTKGKRGAKGKVTSKLEDLPAEKGETENQSPASEEEKEAKSY